MSDKKELAKLMFQANLMRLVGCVFGDKITNKFIFLLKKGGRLDINDPKTFTEKLNYLKLFYDNPLLPVCVDKYYVRQYVEACGLGEILKENYAVYQNPDDIKLDDLPDKCFIQMNHMSRFNYVLDKHNLNEFEQIKKVFKVLRHYNHYWIYREKAFKNITPRIICCEYLQEPGKDSLTDYKFYCFDGEPKYLMVSFGEFSHNVKNIKLDMKWNSIDSNFKKEPALEVKNIRKPENFERMIEVAKILSKGFPHVRVDLYNIEGRIVFGEMTFFSNGGFVNVYSEEMDRKIGSWIDLEKYHDDIRIS